jgi:hypothetical protein
VVGYAIGLSLIVWGITFPLRNPKDEE